MLKNTALRHRGALRGPLWLDRSEVLSPGGRSEELATFKMAMWGAVIKSRLSNSKREALILKARQNVLLLFTRHGSS